MGIAAVAHIYIFPATPYQMMGRDRRRGSVSVLADYAAIDSPLDPEEVRESEKPAVIKFPDKDEQRRREATSLRASVQDVVVVGGGHVSEFALPVVCIFLKDSLLSRNNLFFRVSSKRDFFLQLTLWNPIRVANNVWTTSVLSCEQFFALKTSSDHNFNDTTKNKT